MGADPITHEHSDGRLWAAVALELTSAIQDVRSSELDRRRLDDAAAAGLEDRERDPQVLDRKSR